MCQIRNSPAAGIMEGPLPKCRGSPEATGGILWGEGQERWIFAFKGPKLVIVPVGGKKGRGGYRASVDLTFSHLKHVCTAPPAAGKGRGISMFGGPN